MLLHLQEEILGFCHRTRAQGETGGGWADACLFVYLFYLNYQKESPAGVSVGETVELCNRWSALLWKTSGRLYNFTQGKISRKSTQTLNRTRAILFYKKLAPSARPADEWAAH